MQAGTIIDRCIISSGERVMNETYLKKLGNGSKWYTQTYDTEVAIIHGSNDIHNTHETEFAIILCIIVYQKLKVCS